MNKLPLGLLWAALVLPVACVRRPASPAEELERAAREATEGGPAHAFALAGFHAFLLERDARKAQQDFDSALAKDPSEPFALYGQLLLARRRSHPEAALVAALNLCVRTPRHPLATAGARYALDLAGAAPALDDQILRAARTALGTGLSGEAAHVLRSAVASIDGERGDASGQAATLEQMGVPRAYSVWGPFYAYHALSFDEASPPERDGALSGSFRGPFGELKRRVLSFSDGRLTLVGESAEGDGYLAAVDFDVKAAGLYLVRTSTVGSHKTYLDGTLLFQSRTFERAHSSIQAQSVALSPGRHRILIRLLREERNPGLTLAVLRADGQPANLAFVPAEGPAPHWKGPVPAPFKDHYPTAQSFAEALRPEAGQLLADYIAIRDGIGRDRDGAKALLSELSKALTGPALESLRAELDVGDRTVPSKVARGRATRDLETAVEKDPMDVNALLARANAALDDARPLDAAEFVKQARAAFRPAGYPVPLVESRVQLSLGIDAQAEQSALEALKLQPGLCEAMTMRYELARRRDAVALADELVKGLSACPGHLSRWAEHRRLRGDLSGATLLYEKLAAGEPSQLSTAFRLSDLYVAMRRFDDAAEFLGRLRERWPRSAAIVKHLADMTELSGKPGAALALREEALRLDGGDLTLRRAVERAKTGKEPLAERAIDGKAAIVAYEAQRGSEDSASAYVLDAAAIRAYPDGSMVDRIHTIQKVLDPSGTSEIAEVNLPSGAHVLALRTIKPDGTVLEPENIEGKESLSMPGVQVGDYVEQEFLLAHPARGPGQPGFTASNFYYQIARQPNYWSTYTVLAPKGSRMAVDAHNVRSEQPAPVADEEVFFHEERRVPPYIPEPDSPPSGTEYLPFVSVGSGATGNAGIVATYADAFLDRGQRTFEVEEFARQAATGKSGLEAVRAVFAAVMQKLSGRDAGIATSAAFSLAQDRGSRLWAMKAALETLGIPTRLAAIRTFTTDPTPYKFPNEALLPYVCLRADLPGIGAVWLDPLVRFGPFGELPEAATGEREAWLLPEPGRPLQRVASPPYQAPKPKEVQLHLALTADGRLSGSGIETYQGMEAAQLGEALESLSPDQRNQALQSALSRYFGGANLSEVGLDIRHEVGAPLIVRYQFDAPRFARLEGGKMVLGALTFPAQLGKRYVQLGSRRTPLFVQETESTHTQVELALPPGYALSSPLPELKSSSRFGSFVRHEQAQKGSLRVEETYHLGMGRIRPEQYDDFAQFAGEVDLIQSRDLLLEQR